MNVPIGVRDVRSFSLLNSDLNFIVYSSKSRILGSNVCLLEYCSVLIFVCISNYFF